MTGLVYDDPKSGRPVLAPDGGAEKLERRVPPNSEILVRLVEVQYAMSALESKQATIDRRVNRQDELLEKMNGNISGVIAQLTAHMLQEEKDRSALMLRLNVVLLSILAAVGMAALDFIVNYMRG